MAGGKGTRLRAVTGDVPKALVKLDHDYDILSVILCQLRHHGFDRITVCVSYLAESVRSVRGDQPGDIVIEYCSDGELAGTAGPLRGIARFNDPALVINGDVLTALDFARMHATHVRNGAAMTVGTVRLRLPVEHGVLDVAGGRVTGIAEKPTIELTVSSGVYVVSPQVLRYLASRAAMDMPELIAALTAAGETVDAYRIESAWHDIGTPGGLDRARAAFGSGRERFLLADRGSPAGAR